MKRSRGKVTCPGAKSVQRPRPRSAERGAPRDRAIGHDRRGRGRTSDLPDLDGIRRSLGRNAGNSPWSTADPITPSRKETLSEDADAASFLVYKVDTVYNWESVLLSGTIDAIPDRSGATSRPLRTVPCDRACSRRPPSPGRSRSTSFGSTTEPGSNTRGSRPRFNRAVHSTERCQQPRPQGSGLVSELPLCR